MKVAICEDNQTEAEGVKRIIKNWALKDNRAVDIMVYESAESFLFDYEEKVFDALFLDIQMPGLDGISLAKRLRSQNDNVPIVFVTGIDDFISEGYDVEAVHYLLKPVREDKVFGCLERICEKLRQEEPFVLLSSDSGVAKILQKEILKVEIFSHQCVYTTVKTEYSVSQSLKEAKEKLSDDFVLCHRGILVNLQHIEAIQNNKVFLSNGSEVPVSRRMYGELNQAFICFMMRKG